jgi:hypothetical protein
MPMPGEPEALNRACPVRRGAWGDGLFGYRALCLLYINALEPTRNKARAAHAWPLGVSTAKGFTRGWGLLYPLHWQNNRDIRSSSSPYDVEKRDRCTLLTFPYRDFSKCSCRFPNDTT